MWGHVEVTSDPAKRGVKGHSSPARAGEHPKGLVLACDTTGHVGRSQGSLENGAAISRG